MTVKMTIISIFKMKWTIAKLIIPVCWR